MTLLIGAIEFVIKAVENNQLGCGKPGLNSDFLLYLIILKPL